MTMMGRLRTALTRWRYALDKNTVIYGYGPDMTLGRGATGYVWTCGRCLEGAMGFPSLAEAQGQAGAHALAHPGVSAREDQ